MIKNENLKKKVILIVGPPGSGKGTQGEKLAKKLGYIHISTGDLMREISNSGSDTGKMISQFIKTGDMIPDVIIEEIMLQRLRKQSKEVILLDGFPRTLNQGLLLYSAKELCVDRVILIQVPDNVCMQRLLNRNDPLRKTNDSNKGFNEMRLKFYNVYK